MKTPTYNVFVILGHFLVLAVMLLLFWSAPLSAKLFERLNRRIKHNRTGGVPPP
jgi:hypothetical protein